MSVDVEGGFASARVEISPGVERDCFYVSHPMPRAAGARSNLSVIYSCGKPSDGGRGSGDWSWSAPVVVDPSSSSYSSLLPRGDGRLLALYAFANSTTTAPMGCIGAFWPSPHSSGYACEGGIRIAEVPLPWVRGRGGGSSGKTDELLPDNSAGLHRRAAQNDDRAARRLGGDAAARAPTATKSRYEVMLNTEWPTGCVKHLKRPQTDLPDFDHWKIRTNPGDAFSGPVVATLVGAGKFPSFSGMHAGDWNCTKTNCTAYYGGLPQLTNLSAHLEQLEHDLTASIPDPHWSGVAALDWESWKPDWRQNRYNEYWVYVNRSIELVQQRHPSWPVSRAIIAGIWVAFFQGCQAITCIVRTGGPAGAGCEAGVRRCRSEVLV